MPSSAPLSPFPSDAAGTAPARPHPGLATRVRTEARRLHRQLRSDRLSDALPLLRRLLAAGVLASPSLVQLHAQRGTVQRKHLLELLAREAGHANWSDFAQQLDGAGGAAPELGPLALNWQRSATLNPWFNTVAQAQAYAAGHGGRVVPVGTQAVVLAVGAQEAAGAAGAADGEHGDA